MSQNPNLDDGELNLHELFAVLWAHKIFIILFTTLSIFLSGFYALVAKETFTARAIFQIEENDSSSGFNLNSELSALASLAGVNTGTSSSNSEILLERTISREFIVDMMKKFEIDRDPYFNTYDPNYKDPVWKATIKKIVGWEKTKKEKNALIEHIVIQNYLKNVEFEISDGGAIKISVKHSNPQKAADYSNNFMEELRKLVENESFAAQGLRLNYLSETLADALQDMEVAQEKLKNYALKNSAMAQENFISDSLRLDQLRMERRKVEDIANLLYVIEELTKSGDLDNKSYEALQLKHPLVDDIDFRRILGMSETISAWTWPEVGTIEAVSATLRDRTKRLDVDIKNIEENAKIYATSAEDLAKLTRDAKIAEATYTVLIEQVKSQSLAAGFQPETFKVFEYAVPPIIPSSPSRILLLALGAFLGIFLSSALAFINSARKGVYYTTSTLLSDANADLSIKSKYIKRLSKKTIAEIIPLTSRRKISEVNEAVFKISNKKLIYVINSGGRPSASDTARLLAALSSKSGRSVVLCDTTSESNNQVNESLAIEKKDLPIVNVIDNISLMTQADGTSFFTSTNFSSTIKILTDQFDQVFLFGNTRNAQLGLMALLAFSPGLVVIAGLRKTKKFDIKNIKTRQPIDLLFYD